MPRVLILTLLLQSTALMVSGQSFLYLKKLGGRREVKFYKGEEIRFQLKGDPYFTRGIIEDLGEDFLVIYGTEIPLKDIARFDIKSKNVSWFSFRSSPGKLMIASVALPLIDIGNQLITEGQKSVSLHPSIVIASAALITISLFLRLIEPKYFVLDDKRHAYIVNPTRK